MNEPFDHNSDNVERAIRAGMDKNVRTDPAAREQAWNRAKAAWQQGLHSESNAAASSCDTPSGSRNHNRITTYMKSLFGSRWKLGLTAAVTVAAAIAVIVLAPSGAHATAAQIMTRGAQAAAKLSSIHIRAQLRTAPSDNFSYINADMDFYTVEFWKQYQPDLKWRVEKPGRIAVMDGNSTMLLIKPDVAVKQEQALV